MTNTKHIVLTRFNVPTQGKEKVFRAKPAWLKERFVLFEQFCLPSIEQQTNSNFSWLVFFDIETPAEYKAKIVDYQACKNFNPVYVETWSTDTVHQSIRSFSDGFDQLLTTRLDNDDGLHPNYVKNVQAISAANGIAYYNFKFGLTYSFGKLYRQTHLSNAFMSRLESMDGFQTVWEKQHQDVIRDERVVQVGLRDAWIQVIHEKNVSNKIRGTLVNPKSVTDSIYYLSGVPFKPVSLLEQVFDKLLKHPVRTSRDLSLKAGKRVLGWQAKVRHAIRRARVR